MTKYTESEAHNAYEWLRQMGLNPVFTEQVARNCAILMSELTKAKARDDQWATAVAKFTPFDICKMIADEMERGAAHD